MIRRDCERDEEKPLKFARSVVERSGVASYGLGGGFGRTRRTGGGEGRSESSSLKWHETYGGRSKA